MKLIEKDKITGETELVDTVINKDVLRGLQCLPDNYIDMIITSPPYWGLRNYKVDGQIGQEESPEKYVETLRSVFSAARRVLKDTGTLWLNLGDTYMSGGSPSRHFGYADEKNKKGRNIDFHEPQTNKHETIKPKDLVGIPWRVALALQQDGWYLRSDIIWHKPNAMPESAHDRPSRDHEYIFLFSKNQKYYYDADSIREPHTSLDDLKRRKNKTYSQNITRGGTAEQTLGRNRGEFYHPKGRNKRTVWKIKIKPYPDTHFAVFPKELVRQCVLAGCPEDGIVLDTFAGSGTTLEVATELNRRYVGIELNSDYLRLIKKRLGLTTFFADTKEMEKKNKQAYTKMIRKTESELMQEDLEPIE